MRILLLIAASIAVRQVVIFAGQHWIRTYSHTITVLTLPIITYTITSVIAGNIALSLGLVGALSIVRFRNPVKSPFELVVYFLMITAGIAASVNPIWLIVLIATFVILTIGCEIANRITKERTGGSLFPASFSEGNALSTLTIMTANPAPELAERSDLIGYVADEEGYEYRLTSTSREDLAALATSYEGRARLVDFRAS